MKIAIALLFVGAVALVASGWKSIKRGSIEKVDFPSQLLVEMDNSKRVFETLLRRDVPKSGGKITFPLVQGLAIYGDFTFSSFPDDFKMLKPKICPKVTKNIGDCLINGCAQAGDMCYPSNMSVMCQASGTCDFDNLEVIYECTDFSYVESLEFADYYFEWWKFEQWKLIELQCYIKNNV